MARVVVLWFDDNGDGEEFVEEVKDDNKVEVIALFAMPTQLCECPKPSPDIRSNRRIVLGRKLGWWVHDACGRPVWGSWQSPKNLTTPQGKLTKVHISVTLRNDLYKGKDAER